MQCVKNSKGMIAKLNKWGTFWVFIWIAASYLWKKKDCEEEYQENRIFTVNI